MKQNGVLLCNCCSCISAENFSISCNLAANFGLRHNPANPNISRIFCSARFLFSKIWLRSLAHPLFGSLSRQRLNLSSQQETVLCT